MSRVSEVIEAMVRAVPARKASLDEVEVARLRELTGELMAAKPEAAVEYARFLGVKQRGLCLPEAELTERLGGAIVLVTGGTGCIGSMLMAQLAQRRPGRLVSVSRDVTAGWPRHASAEYLVGDVRDRARMDEIIDNSIVYERLLDWAAADGRDGAGTDLGAAEAAVVRLHGESVAFYVQSARAPAGHRGHQEPRLPAGQAYQVIEYRLFTLENKSSGLIGRYFPLDCLAREHAHRR